MVWASSLKLGHPLLHCIFPTSHPDGVCRHIGQMNIKVVTELETDEECPDLVTHHAGRYQKYLLLMIGAR